MYTGIEDGKATWVRIARVYNSHFYRTWLNSAKHIFPGVFSEFFDIKIVADSRNFDKKFLLKLRKLYVVLIYEFFMKLIESYKL